MLVSVLARISVLRKIVFPCVRGEKFTQYQNAIECEHCHSERARNELFLVEVDGKRMTVGSGCLEKLVGKEKAREALQRAKKGEEEIKNGISAFCLSLEECIDVAYEIIQKYGFVSTANARISDDISTSMRIRNVEGTGTELRHFSQWEKVSEKVKEFVKSLSGDSDFIVNAKTLFGYQEVFAKEIGIVCAVVNMWIRHEQSKGVMVGTSWVGYLGERIKKFDTKAKVFYLGSQDGYYGFYHKYVFECENGLVLSWNTSSPLNIGEGDEYGDAPVEWKEAEVLVESFTVKHHGEWKERGKVTSVSRLKCQVLKN